MSFVCCSLHTVNVLGVLNATDEEFWDNTPILLIVCYKYFIMDVTVQFCGVSGAYHWPMSTQHSV